MYKVWVNGWGESGPALEWMKELGWERNKDYNFWGNKSVRADLYYAIFAFPDRKKAIWFALNWIADEETIGNNSAPV